MDDYIILDKVDVMSFLLRIMKNNCGHIYIQLVVPLSGCLHNNARIEFCKLIRQDQIWKLHIIKKLKNI